MSLNEFLLELLQKRGLLLSEAKAVIFFFDCPHADVPVNTLTHAQLDGFWYSCRVVAGQYLRDYRPNHHSIRHFG